MRQQRGQLLRQVDDAGGEHHDADDHDDDHDHDHDVPQAEVQTGLLRRRFTGLPGLSGTSTGLPSCRLIGARRRS
jgi:hypothetical protein